MAGPLRFTVAAMGPTTVGEHRANAAAWDGQTLWLLVHEQGYAPPLRRPGQKKSELPTRTAGLWRSGDAGSTFQPVCAGEDVLPLTHSVADIWVRPRSRESMERGLPARRAGATAT